MSWFWEIGLGLYEILNKFNVCIVMFIFYSVTISVIGILVHYSKQLPVPDVFLQACKFGKMAHRTAKPWKIVTFLEVPKRWFVHFYIMASVVATLAGIQMWMMFCKNSALYPGLSMALDILTVPWRSATVTGTSAALGLIMLAFHLYRRLYECLFVSVFSSSYMNAFHYIVGHTHYIGAISLLISEAPGFDNQEFAMDVSLEVHHVVGILVYLLGVTLQHQSLQLLAGLRKHGGKDMNKHKIPEGGMFEILSCPHMFGEMLVYLGIWIVLGSHYGWTYVTGWVILNQIQVALMNHSWYKEKFKDYPIKRKAVIPFLL